MKKILNKHSLLILLVISILVRILLFFLWDIRTGGDSNNYIELANYIKSMNFHNYSGIRTPGYPIIVLLAGFKFVNIVILQLCMGIVISVCLYKIMFLLK